VVRLPAPGSDLNTWGTVLNAYLNGVLPYVVTDGQWGGGADPTGVSDSTSAIQAALTAARAAGGGLVQAPPGSYTISGPLRIGSGTTLQLMPGATVTLLPGSACNAVQNWAVQANRRVMDGAVTSASATFTSATAAFTSGDTGSALRVYYPDGTWLDTTVTYASSTTVTMASAATQSGTALYAAIGAGRDSNIRITGGYWVRPSSNYGSPGYNAHHIRVRQCDGIGIGPLRYATLDGKYAVNLGDVTVFSVHDIDSPSSVSDCVHLNGPVSRGSVERIQTGTSGDDIVSLTGGDYITGTGLSDCAGAISNVVVDGVVTGPPSSPGTRGVLLIAGQSAASVAYYMDEITVRNVRTRLTASPVILTSDVTDTTTDGGHWGRILIDSVVNESASPPGYAVSVNGDTCDDIEVRSVTDKGGGNDIVVGSGASVTRLLTYGSDVSRVSVLGTVTTFRHVSGSEADTAVANTWAGATQTFESTVTVVPASAGGSASLYLDNQNGQKWEFFCSNGGQYGVFDDTNSKQPFNITAGATLNVNLSGSTMFVSGNVDCYTLGQGFQVREGANAKQGTATLSSGTVTVSNTSVTANSRIFLTAQDGSTTGALRVSARTAGTSFTITSSNGTDSGVVAYEIFEPG
jgi:hypothetical protein